MVVFVNTTYTHPYITATARVSSHAHFTCTSYVLYTYFYCIHVCELVGGAFSIHDLCIAWLPLYCLVAFVLPGCLCIAWLPLYCLVAFVLPGCPCIAWLPLYCLVALVLPGCPCIAWLPLYCLVALVLP